MAVMVRVCRQWHGRDWRFPTSDGAIRTGMVVHPEYGEQTLQLSLGGGSRDGARLVLLEALDEGAPPLVVAPLWRESRVHYSDCNQQAQNLAASLTSRAI